MFTEYINFLNYIMIKNKSVGKRKVGIKMETIYLVEEDREDFSGEGRFVGYDTLGAYGSLADIKKSFSTLISIMEKNGFKCGLTENWFGFIPDETANPGTIGYKANAILERLEGNRAFLRDESCCFCPFRAESTDAVNDHCIFCQCNGQPNIENLIKEMRSHENWRGLTNFDLYSKFVTSSYRIQKLDVNTVSFEDLDLCH
jgi:hypothetical protein